MKYRFHASIIALILLACVACSCGCGSARLETPDIGMPLNAIHPMPYRVGVEEYDPRVYSDKLIAALRRTELFIEVDYTGNLAAPPDIIAEVEAGVYGEPTIPLLYILTAGIIPYYGTEKIGHVFSIRKSGSDSKRMLDVSIETPFVLGWLACVYNLSPEWRMGDPEKSGKYTEFLKTRIFEEMR